MAKCPTCNANVPIKLSSPDVKCSSCKTDLVAVFSPLGKALMLLILLIECLTSMVVTMIARLLNYPFFQKWVVAGAILLGLIIAALLLFSWIMNETGSYRLKQTAKSSP
jgi:protein-S-isoprenylcysteine O-methyltransferase Ste14